MSKCLDCSKLMFNCAMGVGAICGHVVSSRGLKYCPKCSNQKSQCEACGKDLGPGKKIKVPGGAQG